MGADKDIKSHASQHIVSGAEAHLKALREYREVAKRAGLADDGRPGHATLDALALHFTEMKAAHTEEVIPEPVEKKADW